MFVVARAIRDERGALQGVVGADLDPQRLGEVLRIERTGQETIDIIDGSGRLVYIYPNADLTWEQRNLAQTEPLVAKALAGEAFTGTFRWSVDGKERMGGFAPIPSLGWVVRASRPSAEVTASMSQELLREFALDLFVVVVAFVVAFTIGRHITAPIARLREQATALGRGEFGREREVGGPSELTELANSFSHMAMQIRTREEQLRESEERYRTLAEAAQDVIFIIDRDGRIRYENNYGAKQLGMRPEQIIGKRRDALFPPEAAERQERSVRKVFEAGEPVYSENITPYPSHEVWLGTTLSPIKIEAGEVTAIMGISRDITKRKQVEEERERLLAELDITFTSIADALLIHDTAGKIIRMNPAAENILGYSLEERALPLAERMALLRIETADGKPFTVDQMPAERVLRGEAVRGLVMVIHRVPDGRTFWTVASAAPIRTPDGRLLGVASVFTNITPPHELQEWLQDLVGMVAHDLRNPLTIIQMQAEFLLRTLGKGSLKGTEQHIAEGIVTGAKRMGRMIQDLVDSAGLESGQLSLEKRSVNLKAFVSDLLDRDKGVIDVGRIKVRIPERLPPVLADPDRLERILLNLLTNALKYSPPETEVFFMAEGTDGEVTVSITDRGVGITPEDLLHVFERFYRVKGYKKPAGLGLGLYITKLLVEAHGERTWAESEIDKGSSFYFTLPIA